MKKVILFLFVLIGVVGNNKLYAQMEAAQQIKWDVVKAVDCNMSQDMAWRVISDPEMFKRASNGYITSVSSTEPTSRVIAFSNGNKRSENITQFDKENRFIVIQFNKESLPQGITSAMITIFAKGNDEKSNITWRAKAEGSKEAKVALMEQLKVEFDNYAIGFAGFAKRIIPAMKMQ